MLYGSTHGTLLHVCYAMYTLLDLRFGPGESLGASSLCSWTGLQGLSQMPLMLPRLHVVPSTTWLLPGVI